MKNGKWKIEIEEWGVGNVDVILFQTNLRMVI